MVRAWLWAVVAAGVAGLSPWAFAQDAALLERALTSAVESFEQALPEMGGSAFGVDVGAYRDALTLGQFSSGVWGGTVRVDIRTQGEASGACARFAAYTRVPPAEGVVPLVLCPRFFTPNADELRALTILHEMVHVVAGTDECQAMAFAAQVQQLAMGRFTPVEQYWQASGCAGSRYSLPN
jgi:hypothetical protein